MKFSDSERHTSIRPSSSQRQTGNNSILKSSSTNWQTASNLNDDDQEDFRGSSSALFADDFRRMNKNLQRMSTSDTGAKQNRDTRYM